MFGNNQEQLGTAPIKFPICFNIPQEFQREREKTTGLHSAFNLES